MILHVVKNVAVFVFSSLALQIGLAQGQENSCPSKAPEPLGNETSQTIRAKQTGLTWALGQKFERVLIIVLENKDYDSVLKHPGIAELASKGFVFPNFNGSFHPSYPNYLAMVGGRYFGTLKDEQKEIPEEHKTIADLIEQKDGLTWKQYAEGYPGKGTHCFLGSSAAKGRYQRKHVPFLSFSSVTKNPQRCSNIVSGTAFNPKDLPTYAFYTPDMCHDGHGLKKECDFTDEKMLDVSVAWLVKFLTPILSNPLMMKGTLIIVTFDESRSQKDNRIFTLFLGPMVNSKATATDCFDHYNVLRTIEDNFNLGTLGGEDERSSPITSIWN